MAPDEAVPTWRLAARRIASEFGYGGQVTRSWLEEALAVEIPRVGTRMEIERANLRFFTEFGYCRRELLTAHQMVLRSLGRGSWQVVHPNEQGAFALESLRDGVDRESRKSQEIIDHTRRDLLNEQENQALNEMAAKIAAFNALAGRRLGVRAQVEVRSLPRASATAPDEDDDE